jgi:alanine racemase
MWPQRGAVASYLTLSSAAVAANVRVFRGIEGNARFGAVLKGNAYGHGLEPMVSLLSPLVDVMYVITAAEALAIRQLETSASLPRKEVLVIGMVSPDEAVALAQAQVSAVVAGVDWQSHIEALRFARVKLPVHVHLDTGLGREGFTFDQLKQGAADFLRAASDVLPIDGVLTHFANTEDVTEQSYAHTQVAAFDAMCERLTAAAPVAPSAVRHLAASAAALVLPHARRDVVRVGIALYGLWPSSETRLSARVMLGSVPPLTPVLSWRCPSQVVKWLPAGAYVGYGCTYRCGAPTRVAVLPVGYFDGYPRLLSGRAHVLVNGRRCAVLGRVMMNHIIVDVTQATSDERPLVATLIGRDGDEVLAVEQLADWADTIHYELVTRLGPHLRRVIVDSPPSDS